MASITSLSNSNYNTSSIYGNRNVLSGLASGMDTETMIENAVSGIKLKIQNLTKKRTKIEWQQEAYRSIIDKAANLNQKYTSYSSKTNLMSNSFFTNAVNTTTSGTFKDKISATGKTTSDIKINAVKQLASAATYTVSGLGGKFTGELSGVTGEEALDFSKDMDLSTVAGTLSLKYGGSNGSTFDLSFDELENLNEVEVLNEDGTVKTDATDTEKLAQAIRNKLGEITYNYTKNGFRESTTADKAINVKVDGMNISFEDALGNGNKVSVGSATGDIKDTLGITNGDEEISLTYDTKLTKQVAPAEYMAGKKGEDGKWSGGKELGITFNGVTKKINMSDVFNRMEDGMEGTENARFVKALQEEMDDAFGAGKVQVSRSQDGILSLQSKSAGDSLAVGGAAAKSLGFGEGGTNYVNTSKKLTDLLGKDNAFFTKNRLKAVGDVDADTMTDSAGNKVIKEGDDFYRVDKDGKALYDFKVNGVSFTVNEDTTLENLMNSINSNADAGVKVSYSKLTNEFKFTATETGSNSKIEFDGLAADLFGPSSDVAPNNNFAQNYGFSLLNPNGPTEITLKFDSYNIKLGIDKDTTMQDFADRINNSSLGDLKATYDEKTGQFSVTNSDGVEQKFTIEDPADRTHDRVIEPLVKYTAGRDAIMDVEVNGKRFENLTRSSNTFDIDGLNVTAKGTFNVDGANAPDKDGNEYEAVTFTTTTDSDKIVDAIRSFVDDYNEMATELKNAYSTMPAQKTNGSRYEPLTAEEEDSYSESELKAYNEKAKQGILFGDTTLSSMYSKLLNAIQPGGTDGQTLREIGIGTSYSDGMTTLSLDEDKLRAALESDPDKVRTAFTKTVEGGSSSNGLMQTMQNALNTYVKTTGEPKGVLIARAGSIKAPTSLNSNSLKSQMDNIDAQIDRWTDKMADQIDRYTSKFSKLEQLIAEMNSQSSAMMGLMGGGTSY